MAENHNFRYQHLVSSVQGHEPNPGELKYGEIAVNNYAGEEKLFIENTDGEVVSIGGGDKIDSFYASEEEKYIYLNYNGEQDGFTADCSSWFNGLYPIESLSYDSDYNRLYLYFTNGENVNCSLDGICSGINDIPIITDIYHRDSGSYEYVIGLSYHYLNDSQTTHYIEDDITNWLSGCVRSLAANVDTGYPQHKELGQGRYLLRKYSDSEHGSELFFAEQVDDWFVDFYNYYTPASAYTNGTTIQFYTSGGTYLFSAEYTDTNDNDFVTDFYYSNDSGKTLTLEATNGTWTASLDNLALDCDITSGATAYTNYGDNEYLMFYRNCGKSYSADVSTWFDYYINSGYTSDGYTINLVNSHPDSHAWVSLNLSSWFMGKADNYDLQTLSGTVGTLSGQVSSLDSSFSSHVNDTCAHVTCNQQQYWNGKVDYSDLSGFVASVEYIREYPSGSTTIPALVFYNTKYPSSSGNIVDVVDATPFIKDGMVDDVEVVHGEMGGDYLRITFNTDAGKQPIDVPLTSIFDPSNYYTTSEANGRFITGITAGSNSYDVTYYDGTGLSHTFSLTGISGDVYSISGAISSHTSDTCMHVTCNDQQNWNSAYNTVSTSSSDWNSAYNAISTSGSDWNNAAYAISSSASTWNNVADSASTWNSAAYAISSSASSWNDAAYAISSSANSWNDTAYAISSSANSWNNTSDAVGASATTWNNASDGLTAHTADTTIHFTANDLIASGFVTTQYTTYTEVTDTISDSNMAPITSNAVYDVLDGLKLKKISQSDYDDLVDAGTVDANTLYVIIN
jgi:hypothetical protein